MRPSPAAGARRRLTCRVAEGQAGRRLDAVLSDWLVEVLRRRLSRAAVRRLIMAGAVRVDGQVLRRPGAPVSHGARLEAQPRLDLLDRGEAATPDAPARLAPMAILYEDDAIIAIDKPAGLPTHATLDPARPHLVGLVRTLLEERQPGGGAAYLGLHQRLDRDTSGIVVFTKDPRANPGLGARFARHEVVKTYLALTRRPGRLPPREWRSTSRLARTARRRGPRVATVAVGGSLAETRFRLLEPLPRALLIEATPVTGRTHQIRVQLAQSGMPVLGDAAYGAARGEPLLTPRLMLHATRLGFSHPLSGQPLVIESPAPADFVRTLGALRLQRHAGGRAVRG